jgi:tetratricopeptide (TPR) repeat protein
MSSDNVSPDLPHQAPGGPDGHVAPQETAEAVMLSLEMVREQDRSGLCSAVLDVAAVLWPAELRRDLLRSVIASGHRAGSADHAVDRLVGWSLATVSPDGQIVTVDHHVMQAVRDGLGQRGRFAVVCRRVGSVLEARAQALASSPDPRVARDITHQVTALVEATAEQADDDLATLLLRLRFLTLYHLIELGDSGQAIAFGEPLVADLERLLGAGHPDTLTAENSLAAAYQASGQTGRAIPLFERTWAGRRRTVGPSHPHSLNSQHNLAVAYQDVGRTAEAIPLFKSALAGRERVLGSSHPSTLDSRANLARAYQDAGRAAEAIPLLEQTLIGQEQILGHDHPDTMTTRDDLASARGAAAGLLERQRHDSAQSARPVPVPVPVPVPEPYAAADPIAPELDADPDKDADPESQPEPKLDAEPQPEPDAEPVAEAEPDAEPVAEAEPDAEPVAAPPREPIVPRLEKPVASGRPAGRRLGVSRRMRVPSIVAAVVILLVAGSVTLTLTGALGSHQRAGRGSASGSGAVGRGHQGLTAADAMQMAAAWVGQQVSRSAIVACDPATCAALKARGVPAADLLMVRSTTASPLGAQLVVATPVVRNQFGSRLASVYAPTVIAGFGSGADQVEVRVVAPDGATTYMTALRQDQAARTSAGVELLTNKRIQVSVPARTQLEAGQVDSRLLLMLPIMAAMHPIDIVAFGDPGPGASPEVPLCSALLSGSGRVGAMTDASYLGWLTGFLRAQTGPFAGRVVVQQEGGESVVQVEFARPSPLGLLVSG